MATMQRERPKEREEERPLLTDDTDNMFEGLSFPEAPTKPPVISQGKTVPFNASAISSYDAAIMSKPGNTPVLSDDMEPRAVARKAPPSAVPQAVRPAPTAPPVQNNFKTLYSSELPVARESYPVLPDDRPAQMIAQPPVRAIENRAAAANTTPPVALSAGRAGDVEMQPWGKHLSTSAAGAASPAPTAPALHFPAPAAPTVVRASAPPPSLATAPSDDLVNDLLNENARLKRELEEAARGRTDQTSTASGPVVTGLSSTERAARAVPTASSTMTSSGVTGTNPQTQKYVCCGNCKQWLAAPKEANLVYCPGCEAVNDCSLAEARGNRNVARRLETQPWYLQCFQRFMG